MTSADAFDYFSKRRLLYGVVPIAMLLGYLAAQSMSHDLTTSSSVAAASILAIGAALFVPAGAAAELTVVSWGIVPLRRTVLAGVAGLGAFGLVDEACRILGGERSVKTLLAQGGLPTITVPNVLFGFAAMLCLVLLISGALQTMTARLGHLVSFGIGAIIWTLVLVAIVRVLASIMSPPFSVHVLTMQVAIAAMAGVILSGMRVWTSSLVATIVTAWLGYLLNYLVSV